MEKLRIAILNFSLKKVAFNLAQILSFIVDKPLVKLDKI